MVRSQRACSSFCLSAFLPALTLSTFSPSSLGPVRLSAFQTSSLPPETTQEASFRTGSSELVVLPVVVTDKQGRYVSDLERDRFTVFDNGRRVPIEIFSNEDTPLTIGLIIDASGSMGSKIGEVITASLAFARSSNPEDELFVVRFNDDVQQVIRDRPFLLAEDIGALNVALRSMRPEGRTALYDALVEGIDHLARGSRARKVLVVVSDGGDNASEATLDSVLGACARIERHDLHARHFRPRGHRSEPRRPQVAGARHRRRTVPAAHARRDDAGL